MKTRSMLVALLFAGCTATVQSAPPPSGPSSPPPPPPPNHVATNPQPMPPTPVNPPPPPPDKHPAYMHALADLHNARAFLVRPANVVIKWDENKAIKEIDVSIKMIEGAINQNGGASDAPVQDTPTWGGRLQRSYELLEKARSDVREAEDNPASKKFREEAIEHIGLAAKYVQEGMEDAKKIKEERKEEKKEMKKEEKEMKKEEKQQKKDTKH